MRAALPALIALALALPAVATGSNPRPQCPPSVRHCRVHWVGYTYKERGRDQDGTRYVRTCHVPAHGRRWCGPWKAVGR